MNLAITVIKQLDNGLNTQATSTQETLTKLAIMLLMARSALTKTRMPIGPHMAT